MAQRSNTALSIAGVVTAVASLGLVILLFQMRFSAGDVYPPYSSLRADPLGTRVLHDALAACDGVTVSRSYRPFQQLKLDADTTRIVAGLALREKTLLDAEEIGHLQRFMRKGGRVVVTVFPTQQEPGNLLLGRDADTDDASGKGDDNNAHGTGTQDADGHGALGNANSGVHTNASGDAGVCTNNACGARTPEPGRIRAGEWLGLTFSYRAVDSTSTAVLHPRRESTGLPASLSCHTSLTFTNHAAGWHPLYERDGRAVMLKRDVGDGALVLSAVSYFLSNEAMRAERYPALLAWLVGGRRHVVFDEYHHGIARTDGVVSLARTYGLQGVAAVLLVLAVLFVWNSTYTLVPRDAAPPDTAFRTVGRGSLAGLVNLLRRNVPAAALPRTCFEQWRQTHARAASEDQIARIEAVLADVEARPKAKRDVVGTHRRISEILNEQP